MVPFDRPGRRREKIYSDKSDYIVLIDLLREAREVLNVCFAAHDRNMGVRLYKRFVLKERSEEVNRTGSQLQRDS
jgi:hypothetical protein